MKIIPQLLALLVLASPVFADEAPLLRDFIGLNGHTVQFRPELYRPVCRLVRDYHPVAWDLGNDSSKLPPFPLAKNGVDWSHVYGSWRARDWQVDVSLLFETGTERELAQPGSGCPGLRGGLCPCAGPIGSAEGGGFGGDRQRARKMERC
ncbi:MAG: hypothetical protein QM796_16445 [Chthoniobacteraceae bacterium]